MPSFSVIVDFNNSNSNRGTLTVDYSVTYSNNSADTCTVQITGARYTHSANYGHTIGVTLKIDGSKVWSTSNRKVAYNASEQVLSVSSSKVYAKSHVAQTSTIEAILDDRLDDYCGNEYATKLTKSATGSHVHTIAAKSSWTVTYNANGGTGAPAAQTKWQYETLRLSSTKPTRTGYTFVRWNTSVTNNGTPYDSGSMYTADADAILYAIWGCTVAYNANGGSGAPASQTKVFYEDLTLSTDVPVRAGYTFIGWNSDPSGSSALHTYQPGERYINNVAITLYAIWKKTCLAPTITSLVALRCNSSGTADDEGTYCKVTCAWKVDTTSQTVTSNYGTVTGTLTVYGTANTRTITWSSGGGGSGVTSGTATAIVSGITIDDAYIVVVSVTDKADDITGAQRTTSRATIVTSVNFFLDFRAGGTGLGIGAAAPADGLRIGWDTEIDGDVDVVGGGIDVQSDNLARNSAYSSTVEGNGQIKFVDSAGNQIGRIYMSKNAAGELIMSLVVYMSTTSYTLFSLKRTTSGSTYYISDAAGFRNAIGASSGVFGRGVGGTGADGRIQYGLTRATNISSSAGSALSWRNGVMVTLAATGLTLVAALATGSSVPILSIPSNVPKPPTTIWAAVMSTNATATGKGYVTIATNGAITFYNRSGASWATSYPIAFTVSWAE